MITAGPADEWGYHGCQRHGPVLGAFKYLGESADKHLEEPTEYRKAIPPSLQMSEDAPVQRGGVVQQEGSDHDAANHGRAGTVEQAGPDTAAHVPSGHRERRDDEF